MSKPDKIEELQNLIKKDPHDFQLRRELAVLLIDCGYNDEALKNLLYLSSKYTDDVGIFYNLGIVYEKLKNFSKAKDAYLKAISIDNKFYDAIYNLGLVYSELKEYDNAIDAFNKVLKDDSNDSNTYFNIGLAYFQIFHAVKINKFVLIRPAYNNAGVSRCRHILCRSSRLRRFGTVRRRVPIRHR